MDHEILVIREKQDLEAVCSAEDFARTLSVWLGQWGDPADQVLDALGYVFSGDEGKGGFLVLAVQFTTKSRFPSSMSGKTFNSRFLILGLSRSRSRSFVCSHAS